MTVVSRLEGADREHELARMIAGDSVSVPVLASARDMLTTRQIGEGQAKGESESHRKAKAKGRPRGA